MWVWVPRIPGVRVLVCHLVSDSCTGGTSRPAVDSRDPRIRQITFHPLTHSLTPSIHQFFPFFFFQPPPPAHPPPSSPP